MRKKNKNIWQHSEEFSLGRHVIEIIASRWAVERVNLSVSALKFYTENESMLPLLPEEKKKGILQYVSNILNALSRKRLVHLVKRKYVLNVPRILYLYHVNLAENSTAQDKERHALLMAAGGILQSLGEATFPRDKALSLAKELVEKYYEKHYDFLEALKDFIENAVKLYTRLSEPETSKYFEDEVMRLIDGYMYELILEPKKFATKFAEELLALIVKTIEDEELVSKTLESWRHLDFETELLTRDKDFRVASYARGFLYKVIRIELASELTSRII